MVNGKAEEARALEAAPIPGGGAENLSENLQVQRAQARELAVRFGFHDPELLAIVLKVTPDEARALLVGEGRE